MTAAYVCAAHSLGKVTAAYVCAAHSLSKVTTVHVCAAHSYFVAISMSEEVTEE